MDKYIKDNKNILPELRFPQFKKDDIGVEQTLGDFSTLITEKVGNRKFTLLSITAGVGLVTQLEKFGREIAGASYKNYIVIYKEDFAFNKSSTKLYPEGQISMLEDIDSGAVPNSIFTCFRVNKKIVCPDYLKFLFENNTHGKWLRKFIAVGARAHGALNIDDKDLFSMPIIIPEPKEQQKIADCLSSLDELIEAQSQKLEVLQDHKKGLMQNLFPAEGETVPKLRFSEFKDDGEWEGKVLDTLTTKVGSGITPKGGDKNYKKRGRPFIRSQNIGWGELLLDDIAFINEDTHNTFSGTELLEKDVLLNITGASIGRAAVADSRITGGNVNQHVCIIRTIKELNPLLLSKFLISPNGQKQIDRIQAGGNRQGLNFAQIKSFKIPLPPGKKEQQKIADCLSSIDGLITAQTQKMEALKQHKKGLMQGLFPKLAAR